MTSNEEAAGVFPECGDLRLQGEMALHVVWAIATGTPIDLAPAWKEHLRSCPACRGEFARWLAKGFGAQDEQEANDLERLAEQGELSVLGKTVSAGVALFRPDPGNPDRGFLVIREIARPHFRILKRRVSRLEFDALT